MSAPLDKKLARALMAGAITGLQILIEDGDISAFIDSHQLEYDVNVLEQVVLLPEGMQNGFPAVMLVGTIDGKKRVLKTSLRLLITAAQALNARTEQELGPGWRGP